MKWKCTECVAIAGDPNTGRCTLDVPHLDASMDGPPDCPWNSCQEAVWFPVEQPFGLVEPCVDCKTGHPDHVNKDHRCVNCALNKLIKQCTPGLCQGCGVPTILSDNFMCPECERRSR